MHGNNCVSNEPARLTHVRTRTHITHQVMMDALLWPEARIICTYVRMYAAFDHLVRRSTPGALSVEAQRKRKKDAGLSRMPHGLQNE